MNQEEFKAQLSEYLDGDMSPVRLAEMARKADSCPECRALLEDVQALTDRLRRLPRVEPSAGFNFALRSHLLMEVGKERRLMGRVPFPVRVFVGVAAAVLIGLGLMQIYPRPNGPVISGTGEVAMRSAEQGTRVVVDHRGALKGLAKGSYSLSGRQVKEVYGLSTDTVKAEPTRSVVRSLKPDLRQVKQVKVKF